MTSTLSFSKHVPVYQAGNAHEKLSSIPIASAAIVSAAYAGDEGGIDKRYYLLGIVVIALHIAAVWGYIHRDTSSHYVPEKHEVLIEFIKPAIIPPPIVEPPPPPPVQPKVQKVTPPPPQPALRTQAASEVIAPNDVVVQENTEAAKSTGPVVASAVPTPPAPAAAPAVPALAPAPVVEEPITEATANAAYLNNPAPDYPATASRNGWGGTVVLRVRVSASGSALEVTVKKSSGRKVLDESAIAAVKNWTFVPSKRGSKPIDGWATVPIIFNPEQ